MGILATLFVLEPVTTTRGLQLFSDVDCMMPKGVPRWGSRWLWSRQAWTLPTFEKDHPQPVLPSQPAEYHLQPPIVLASALRLIC
jgi:hypothetical protein